MDCVKNTYPTFTLNGVETDDVIGLAYTDLDWEDSECIMVTADKDLHQICGWIYNPFEDNPKVMGIHQLQADIWHMVQTLAGDSADNYKGCPGYGEVRARRLVSKAHATKSRKLFCGNRL
jgi:DNA polymerase-1